MAGVVVAGNQREPLIVKEYLLHDAREIRGDVRGGQLAVDPEEARRRAHCADDRFSPETVVEPVERHVAATLGSPITQIHAFPFGASAGPRNG